MNETQEQLLKLVCEIDSICEEHGLKYYMGGGCLIGAMRNRGFLPWDDDADIHMTRKDAYRFRDLYHEGKLPPNRALVSYEDFKPCYGYHWRYEDTSCSAVLRSTMISNVPQGQYVDIFVLDPASDSVRQRKQFRDDYELMWDLYVPFVILSKRSEHLVRRYNAWRKVSKVIGESFIIEHLQNKLLKVPNDDSVDVIVQADRPPQSFWPRRFFGVGRRVPFENTTICVPELAEEILTFAYGEDWVNVPRFAEREGHALIVDVDFPYEYYERDFQCLSGSAEGRRSSRKYKDAWFLQLNNRNYANPRIVEMRVTLRAKEFEQSFDECRDSIEELVNLRDYTGLREFFFKFYSLATEESVSYWGVYIPVSDSYLYQALVPLVMTGDYSFAFKLITKRLQSREEALSDELSRLYEICLDAKSVMADLWTFHDYGSAQKTTDKRICDDEVSVVFYRAKLMLSFLAEDLEFGRWHDLDKLAQSYLAQYPNDGELLFWSSHIASCVGRHDEAQRYLELSVENLSNGILLTYARDLLQQELD